MNNKFGAFMACAMCMALAAAAVVSTSAAASRATDAVFPGHDYTYLPRQSSGAIPQTVTTSSDAPRQVTAP